MDIGLRAAIGIGSNSVRLLIVEAGGERLSAVERLETVTRLASYRSSAGGGLLLEGEAIRRTCATASNFAHHAWERGATLVAALATEAVRAADNRAALIEPLEKELGVPVTIISGEEETRLGWRATALGYNPGSHLGVMDIGGASTDLSVGRCGADEPEDVASLKVGARTLMHRYRLDWPTKPAGVISIIESLMADLGPHVMTLQPRPEIAVVIGGTASVLAEMRDNSLDRDSWTDALIECGWLERTLDRLAPVDLYRRAAAGVPHDRADVVVAGGAILLAILNAWDLRHFYISQRNILDGFFATLERSNVRKFES